MSNSNKQVAVIGEKEIAQLFRVIGYDCFYETEKNAIIQRCQDLCRQDYKIILILEKAAQQIEAYLNSRDGIPYPIILVIPDTITNSNYGRQRLNHNLEKAMGVKLGGK